jgi:hypothetical protein
MSTKNDPTPYDCYAMALPDEVIFVLLARDPCAPALVRAWAYHREYAITSGRRPETDRMMVEEARRCADAMEAWRQQNDGAWRIS